MHFQLHNSDLSEELLGIKSYHTKQYSAGFPLRIIFWLKMPPSLMFFVVPTRWENPEDGGGTGWVGESHPTAKNLLIFSTRNFHVILFPSFICISSHFCYIIFQLLCTHISTLAWHWMVKIHLIETCITPIF